MLLELTTNRYVSAIKASQREQLIHLKPKLDRNSGQNIRHFTQKKKKASHLYLLIYTVYFFFWGADAGIELEIAVLEHP